MNILARVKSVDKGAVTRFNAYFIYTKQMPRRVFLAVLQNWTRKMLYGQPKNSTLFCGAGKGRWENLNP